MSSELRSPRNPQDVGPEANAHVALHSACPEVCPSADATEVNVVTFQLATNQTKRLGAVASFGFDRRATGKRGVDPIADLRWARMAYDPGLRL